MSPLDNLSPQEFIKKLQDLGEHRAAFVFDPASEKLRPSHPGLEDIADAIQQDRRDYHRHEALFFEVGRKSGALLGAFVHKTVRGQAAGGVRLWPYDSLRAYVRDGLLAPHVGTPQPRDPRRPRRRKLAPPRAHRVRRLTLSIPTARSLPRC